MQLWEYPERFDAGKASLRTFLAVLARRRAIDQLRRTGRRTTNEDRSGRQALASVPNLEESAMSMIEAERVRAAVARLPDDQRRAIELAYFEGLTFREVAGRPVPMKVPRSRVCGSASTGWRARSLGGGRRMGLNRDDVDDLLAAWALDAIDVMSAPRSTRCWPPIPSGPASPARCADRRRARRRGR